MNMRTPLARVRGTGSAKSGIQTTFMGQFIGYLCTTGNQYKAFTQAPFFCQFLEMPHMQCMDMLVGHNGGDQYSTSTYLLRHIQQPFHRH